MKSIDGQFLKQLFLSAANNLYNHYPEVDRLNVFPVPDGDTGMNMNLTLTSGSKEITNRNDNDVSTISALFSKGLLMGARGNSGVITSQIFHGFADGLTGKQVATAEDLVVAMLQGKETAYKAVQRPVEGTILTVIRESSSALAERIGPRSTIEEALDILLEEAKKSLQHTPDLLPVLKEVGVVDSGGAGLCLIIEGMALAAHDQFVERNQNMAALDTSLTSMLGGGSQYAGAQLTEDEEGYGYCTQVLIRLGKPEEGKKKFVEKDFQRFLTKNGNSLVLVRDDDIVKVHVHTLRPGSILNYAQQYGEFLTVSIENMSEEHHNIEHGDVATDMESNIHRANEEKKNTPLNEYGIIAVNSGDGLDEVFKELGATVIVSGGQTMNPATEDFVKAIEKAHAKHIYILPNNGNIVMAATLACGVLPEDGEVKAEVIPSKTIPQGLAAIMQFSPEADAESNSAAMKEGITLVRSGSVTYAIKDTDIDGVHVTKDHFMAMKEDKTIVACLPDKKEALLALLDDMVNEESVMVTVYLGEGAEEDEEALSEILASRYPDVEVMVSQGGQPVYSYLVSVE